MVSHGLWFGILYKLGFELGAGLCTYVPQAPSERHQALGISAVQDGRDSLQRHLRGRQCSQQKHHHRTIIRSKRLHHDPSLLSLTVLAVHCTDVIFDLLPTPVWDAAQVRCVASPSFAVPHVANSFSLSLSAEDSAEVGASS